MFSYNQAQPQSDFGLESLRKYETGITYSFFLLIFLIAIIFCIQRRKQNILRVKMSYEVFLQWKTAHNNLNHYLYEHPKETICEEAQILIHAELGILGQLSWFQNLTPDQVLREAWLLSIAKKDFVPNLPYKKKAKT